MKPHLWRGQWLDDDELANQLPHLATQLAADLDRPPPLSALLQAAQALGQSLQQEGGLRQRLLDALLAAPEARHADALAVDDSVAGFLQRQPLEYKLERELGSTAPFTPAFSITAARLLSEMASSTSECMARA